MGAVPEEFQPVVDLIASYRSGLLVPGRDNGLIKAACDLVEANVDNPLLCSSVDPMDLEGGQAVTFHYGRPDVNGPWRFGVVDKFNAGCWIIYTFNITRRRDPKTDKPRPDGPGFRQYDTREMKKIRLVLSPAAVNVPLAESAALANIGRKLVALFDEIAPNRKP